MIDEVSDVFGWERKHTIKALNGKVSLGAKAKKRGSKPKFGTAETEVIIAIWKLSEQPCSLRPKETLPDWLPSYEKHYGPLDEDIQKRITSYSARALDRIAAPHRASGEGGRRGRKTGRTNHRLKTLIPHSMRPSRSGYTRLDGSRHSEPRWRQQR